MSKVKNSELTRYMKKLEVDSFLNSPLKINNKHPIIIRLDGVNFSRWSSENLSSKHDPRLPKIFELTLTPMFNSIPNLKLVYQQSDEVNLLIMRLRKNSQHPFGGKILKLVTILSSILSVNFTLNTNKILGNYRPAYFDARFILPKNDDDIVNYFKWRFLDSIRNSIISYAKEVGHSKNIHGMTKWEIVEFLKSKGYNWFDLPDETKFGFFLIKNCHENNKINKIITKNVQELHNTITNNIFENC